MKLEYDKDANAAYLYIVDSIKRGGVAKTLSLNDNILLDFDKKGRVLGVEILSARKLLSRKVLMKAKRIDKK